MAIHTTMKNQLRIVIHWKKYIYDDLIITPVNVKSHVRDDSINDLENNNILYKIKRPTILIPKYLNNKDIHSYAVSAYIDTMKRSSLYHQFAARRLMNYARRKTEDSKNSIFLIKLRSPKKQFLDYKWGERLYNMALERKEVDNAMSWLSTLGGAFSALGDSFEHCAVIAGKISLHQIMLALKLRDPLLVAKCKLYAALSIIQQNNLKLSRRMIEDIFKYAKENKDILLQRMCQGVWAKLRYCYKLRSQHKKQLKR